MRATMHLIVWFLGLPVATLRGKEARMRWNSRLLVAARTGRFYRQPPGMRYDDTKEDRPG